MPLVKDGRVTEDEWKAVGDDDARPDGCSIIVTLDRWQNEREELRKCNQPLGIRLRSDQSPNLIEEDLGHFGLIALEFPVYKDGRAYSYARRLRDEMGYEGEIRAVGNVLRDQFLFMLRCGFDSFEVQKEKDVAAWKDALAEMSVFYQPGADTRTPVLSLRQRKLAAKKAN